MLGKFIQLVLISIALGLVFGAMCSLVTKHCRFIAHSAINESALFLCFALLSYYVSELLEASAIATILVTSIVLSHYSFYNLSPQGKHVTSVTFQTLGYMAEATVFAFVGVISAKEIHTKYICI